MTVSDVTKFLGIGIGSGMTLTVSVWLIAYGIRFLINLMKGGYKK